MPPDSTDEFDDADLPGLSDESPRSEPKDPNPEWDDADLPGLEVEPPRSDQSARGQGQPPSPTPTKDGQSALGRYFRGWAPREFIRALFGRGSTEDELTVDHAKEEAEWRERYGIKEPKAPTLDLGQGDPPGSAVDELADYPALETLVDAGHRLGGLPQWIVIVGGFGIVGVVLATLFVLRSGSDDPETAAVAIPSDTVVTTTVAPTTTAAAEPTTPPTTARAAQSTLAIAIEDPLNWVTVTAAEVLADPNDDAWVVATPATPWIAGPPPDDAAWSLIVDIGLDLGTQVHSVRWTLHDGSTRGESHIEGAIEAALAAEMWLTPDGRIAVRLPGTSPTGGLSAGDVGAGAMITLFGQSWPTADGEIERTEETIAAGAVPVATEPLPLPGWQQVETEFGPITLIVPDISDT